MYGAHKTEMSTKPNELTNRTNQNSTENETHRIKPMKVILIYVRPNNFEGNCLVQRRGTHYSTEENEQNILRYYASYRLNCAF